MSDKASPTCVSLPLFSSPFRNISVAENISHIVQHSLIQGKVCFLNEKFLPVYLNILSILSWSHKWIGPHYSSKQVYCPYCPSLSYAEFLLRSFFFFFLSLCSVFLKCLFLTNFHPLLQLLFRKAQETDSENSATCYCFDYVS